MKPITDGDNVIVPLIDRLLGRTIAEDIKDTDGTVLVSAGTTMNRDDIKKVSHLKLQELKVRSGLTCGLEYGICQKCYGWAMTTQKLVDIGEAIGIIAAQSIGEDVYKRQIRYRSEFTMGESSKVDFVGVSPIQIISVATSLIP